MITTGGGAGIGGWALKDHPQVQALLTMVLGKSTEADSEVSDVKGSLESVVSDVLKRGDSRKPGVYRVKIAEVELDPKLFSQGRTVDIQARVRKIDGKGHETTVWESKHFGENLAVAGKDDLTATWLNRPFEIAWAPGDQVIVDVWDRKSGLFNPKELKMALPEPGVFPLATGIHALELSGRDRSAHNSDSNRIVVQSERLANSAPAGAQQVAERPIVIK
jgi:hypothetical protein